MAIHCLLAVVMCRFVLLQGTRMNHGVAREVQSSRHPDNVDTSDFADVDTSDFADDDEQLLACDVVETKDKIVIQGKDKPFWDYYYQNINWEEDGYDRALSINGDDGRPLSISCKIYTPPAKPQESPTSHVPEDLIGHIASFHDSAVHCRPCRVRRFNMRFLEKCRTSSTREEFLMIHRQVKEEGGFCKTKSEWGLSWGFPFSRRRPEDMLQKCIRHNAYDDIFPELRHFAACELERESDIQKIIKENEEKILALQEFVNERKQDIVNLKHISEGL